MPSTVALGIHIRYEGSKSEMLNDLAKDPQENHNVADAPKYAEFIATMKKRLKKRQTKAVKQHCDRCTFSHALIQSERLAQTIQRRRCCFFNILVTAGLSIGEYEKGFARRILIQTHPTHPRHESQKSIEPGLPGRLLTATVTGTAATKLFVRVNVTHP